MGSEQTPTHPEEAGLSQEGAASEDRHPGLRPARPGAPQEPRYTADLGGFFLRPGKLARGAERG